MTDISHPITPPTELVTQWKAAASNIPASLSADPGERRDYIDYIATQAARWGADMELAAICEWKLSEGIPSACVEKLCAARRPKPPSLKEQAQRILVENGTTLDGRMELDLDDIAIIRRALEALPD